MPSLSSRMIYGVDNSPTVQRVVELIRVLSVRPITRRSGALTKQNGPLPVPFSGFTMGPSRPSRHLLLQCWPTHDIYLYAERQTIVLALRVISHDILGMVACSRCYQCHLVGCLRPLIGMQRHAFQLDKLLPSFCPVDDREPFPLRPVISWIWAVNAELAEIRKLFAS